jgi:hypothetical protein
MVKSRKYISKFKQSKDLKQRELLSAKTKSFAKNQTGGRGGENCRGLGIEPGQW